MELELSLEQTLTKYDNSIIMGDINIDLYNKHDSGYNRLKQFCDTFNLTNLIKDKTCHTKNHKSSIDIILTNKPKSFQHTVVFETGIGDYHLMICTSLKTCLVCLR